MCINLFLMTCHVDFQERKRHEADAPFTIRVPAADNSICAHLLRELRAHVAANRSLAATAVCLMGEEFVPLGRLVEVFFTHTSQCGLLCRAEGERNVAYLPPPDRALQRQTTVCDYDSLCLLYAYRCIQVNRYIDGC